LAAPDGLRAETTVAVILSDKSIDPNPDPMVLDPKEGGCRGLPSHCRRRCARSGENRFILSSRLFTLGHPSVIQRHGKPALILTLRNDIRFLFSRVLSLDSIYRRKNAGYKFHRLKEATKAVLGDRFFFHNVDAEKIL
jgi:hypothetical protein